jgi:DNA-binding CsgD family transcriptional regulator
MGRMPQPAPSSERRILSGLLVAFAAVALLSAIDIVSDLREGADLGHVAAETGVLVVGLLGAAFMARRLILVIRHAHAMQREALDLAQELTASRAEAARWRNEARELMSGLAQALDQQFDRWSLSPAEKEVALLLLKGLSHKDIAEVRSVTEATARQQARAVYKKAGLSGRHDLAAFFLEDLMLPTRASEGPIEPHGPSRRSADPLP